jgi:adhesin HecA-like repeat protein
MEIPQALVDAKTALELAARRLANDASLIEGTLTQVNRAIAELHRIAAADRRVP